MEGLLLLKNKKKKTANQTITKEEWESADWTICFTHTGLVEKAEERLEKTLKLLKPDEAKKYRSRFNKLKKEILDEVKVHGDVMKTRKTLRAGLEMDIIVYEAMNEAEIGLDGRSQRGFEVAKRMLKSMKN